jgi:hypothetical protein
MVEGRKLKLLDTQPQRATSRFQLKPWVRPSASQLWVNNIRIDDCCPLVFAMRQNTSFHFSVHD